ncbi:MAG TPA: M24 family metallopeptidase [Ilumatobacter sp.]|nr:M24 family metallopeptidase [Ilumatobacter sp.]
MTNAPSPTMPAEDRVEYRRRFETARAVMRAAGLDALVIGSGPAQLLPVDDMSLGAHGKLAQPRYHRWFSGFHIWGAESVSPQPVVVVLPLEGEPSLVVRPGTLRTWITLARAHTWIDRIVSTYHDDPEWEARTNWGLSANDLAADVARAIEDSGLAAARIGIVGGWPGFHDTLAALPKASFESTLTMDAAGNPIDMLWELVATNSAWEIGRLERAQASADDAMRAFMTTAQDGVPIAHALSAARAITTRDGSDDTLFEITCGTDPWALWIAPNQPPGACYRTGSLVTLGLMNSVDGYWIQMPRTWMIGGPNPAQQRVFDAAKRSLDAMLARLEPGVTGGQLWDAGLAEIHGAGFEPRGRLGHSVGFTGVTGPERFSLLPGNNEPLEDGVAFVLHPCVWDKSTGIAAQLGDSLVMEDGRWRFLSPDPVSYATSFDQ